MNTPTEIRHYLSRRHTDVRKGQARIVQAFDPTLGWHNLDLPVTLGTAITLCRRGQTMLAVAYDVPGTGRTQRAVADFSIKECLS